LPRAKNELDDDELDNGELFLFHIIRTNHAVGLPVRRAADFS
jgi:hypothetical protein